MGLLLIIFSGLLILIALAGSFNFPYIPMLFGVYGAERESLKGRLVSRLLLAFPLIALVGITVAWTCNPGLIALPFLYLGFLWLIRPNKTGENDLDCRFKDKEENRLAMQREMDYEWGHVADTWHQNGYLLVTFLSRDKIAAQELQAEFANMPLHSPLVQRDLETPQPEQDKSLTVTELRILLNAQPKQRVSAKVNDIVDIAWRHRSIVSSLNLLSDS